MNRIDHDNPTGFSRPASRSALSAAGVLLVTAVLASQGALAASGSTEGAEVEARLDRRVEALDAQLDLSDEQAQEIRGILEQQRAAAREHAGGSDSQPSPAALAELRAIRAETRERIEAVLNAEQIAAYRRYIEQQQAQRADTLLERNLAMLTERLDLSPEQVEAIRPVLAERMSRMQAALPEPDSGRRARRKAMREMRAVARDTDQQMAAILSADQMEAYEALRDERRARMREQLQQHGGG